MDVQWQELENYVRESAAIAGVNFVTLAVSIDGTRRVLSSSSDGCFTNYLSVTEFESGCVSRVLIAVLALTLHDLQLIDIDRPIGEYLTELSSDERYGRISLRHLLSHTAGYEGIGYTDEADVTIDQLLPKIRYAPQIFSPGSVFNYEGSNSLLACAILARVMRRPIKEQILTCISKLRTSREDIKSFLSPFPPSPMPGQGCDAGWGSTLAEPMLMKIDVDTLMSVGEAICGRSNYCATQIDFSGFHEKGTCLPRVPSATANTHMPIAYGIGTAIYRNGLRGHDGRTDEQNLSFRFSAKRRLVIALGVATNVAPLRNTIMEGALQRLGIESEPMLPCEEVFDLNELVGVYAGSSTTVVEVKADAKSLNIRIAKDGLGAGVILRGEIDDTGHLEFVSNAILWNPTFFRAPDSGCPCLMFGVKTFRRVSAASLGLNRRVFVSTERAFGTL